MTESVINMQFEWKNRSEHDLLILELATQSLTNKAVCIRNHQINSERFKHYSEFFFFDGTNLEVITAQALLNVDMEWLYGLVQHRRGDDELILAGNTPADVLPAGWKLEMRSVSICDECTEENPCCVYPYVFIVKEGSSRD